MLNKKSIKKATCIICGRTFFKLTEKHPRGRLPYGFRAKNMLTCSKQCARTFYVVRYTRIGGNTAMTRSLANRQVVTLVNNSKDT